MIPPTWAIGYAIEPTSPSSSPTRPCNVQPCAAANSVASVCRAPFGSPLDPEVKYTHSVAAGGEGSDATAEAGADGAASPTTTTFGAVGRPDAISTKSVPRQTPGTRMNSAPAVATA